jgi:histidinol-phosphate aminotransferase
MKDSTLNRRQFAASLGLAVGGALVLPEITGTLANAAAAAKRAPQHAHKADVEGAIQIDANENPYGPSQKARDAITSSELIASRYPDAVDSRVVDAIAAHHKVPASQVLLGCGSTEILRCADLAFLQGGKNVVAAHPTFESVLQFAKVMQSNPITVPLTSDHRHDLKAMGAAVNAQTGLVYICNPNNPTGTIVTLDELRAFVDHVPLNVTVLVDEAYFHFVEDGNYGSVVDWLPKYPNLVIARTFSKVYGMAGMRLGYAVSTEKNIQALDAFKLWSNTNIAVLEAAIASLNDPEHVREQRNKNIATRRWLYNELDRDGRTYIPSHTNFMMIEIGRDVGPVQQAFAEKKIFIGRKFPTMENWLRVSMGTPGEMLAFMQALREIVPATGAKTA